jgi:UDP-N-acetylglucosamine acyltransferase
LANRIHPTAIIGDGVELGDGNIIGPYSVVLGPCRIGDGNWLGPHVTIGTPAEHRDGPHPVGWDGELDGQGVRIGDHNRIREYVAVHQGIQRETRIGNGCYFLARSHVAHDSVIGDEITLSSSVQLGGHVEVWSGANLGLGVVVHQYCRIGPGAMIGMGAAVRREIGAFVIAVGVPAKVSGINAVGLRRRGCDEATIEALAPFLTGGIVRGVDELPVQGVPDDVRLLLKAWAERPEL